MAIKKVAKYNNIARRPPEGKEGREIVIKKKAN